MKLKTRDSAFFEHIRRPLNFLNRSSAVLVPTFLGSVSTPELTTVAFFKLLHLGFFFALTLHLCGE